VSGRLVALTTVATAEDAERLACALVERRLAACVNVVPGVVSHYRWKGELQRDQERLLVIKTRAQRLDALRAALAELHPYELPELVALEIAAGHAPYLAWLDDSVREGSRRATARAPRAPARDRPRGRRRPRSPR
jgi:periplasmic divalent cation tolerance protein